MIKKRCVLLSIVLMFGILGFAKPIDSACLPAFSPDPEVTPKCDGGTYWLGSCGGRPRNCD